MVRAAIGLGSNLGDKAGNIERAIGLRVSAELDANGTYAFDGSIVMDVVYASTHDNSKTSDSKIVARNGLVDLAGEGSLTMTVGILVHSTLGDVLRHSVLTGETATDALLNNLAGVHDHHPFSHLCNYTQVMGDENQSGLFGLAQLLQQIQVGKPA